MTALTLSTLRYSPKKAKYLSAEVLLIVTVLSFLNRSMEYCFNNSYLRNIQAVAYNCYICGIE